MYSKINATTMTVRMSVMAGKAGGSGVLQHHLDDDVASVAAKVNRLLHQLVKVLQEDHLEGSGGRYECHGLNEDGKCRQVNAQMKERLHRVRKVRTGVRPPASPIAVKRHEKRNNRSLALFVKLSHNRYK
jgi:hypothetical protein